MHLNSLIKLLWLNKNFLMVHKSYQQPKRKSPETKLGGGGGEDQNNTQ